MTGNIIRTIITPSILHVSRSGRTTVPVRPIQSAYAQFEHIRGIPSWNRDKVVPFSKLRYMDALIGRLSQIQRKDRAEFIPIDTANPEKQIIKMQAELHNSASAVRPLFGGVFSKPAPLFSLTA